MLIRFDFYNKEKNNSVSSIIEKIKAGDENLKEQFIKDNVIYITKLVSNILGVYVDDKNSEEFSIGLSAFNEAIDKYDAKRSGDFFKYSYMVIKNRIIDNVRKNKKHANILLFSTIENNPDFCEKYMIANSQNQFEKIEIQEELQLFEQYLKEYEIYLGDLVSCSPKHQDSKLFSIKIARVIAENEELFSKMTKKKCIPLSDLLRQFKVNKKTVVRNRKFIIAVTLILRSNLDDLKAFILNSERR
jgi:RNA polymerase sigma factor